ncbi:MAG: elongation factor 1-beta [Candidatus Pacearchaeota archaeon]
MGTAIIKYKIMPLSPDADLNLIEGDARDIIKEITNSDVNVQIEPIAFGLKALILTFAFEESKSVDETEEKLKQIENVSSVEVVDFRRALG